MKKSELMFELDRISKSYMVSMYDIAAILENTIERFNANQNSVDIEFDTLTATEELNTAVDSIMRAHSTFKVQSNRNGIAPTLQMVVDFTSSVSRTVDTYNEALLFEMM